MNKVCDAGGRIRSARFPRITERDSVYSSRCARILHLHIATHLSSLPPPPMSASDTPATKGFSPPLTNQDLLRVENALEDMNVIRAENDRSAPPIMFGAGGPMCVCLACTLCISLTRLPRLKQFDQSTAVSRTGSATPRSVVGIGNKGTIPLSEP